MSATNDSAYQYTKIGADAERAAKKAAEDNLPVDMMNDRRMQSYAGLWAIIGAKAAATVVLAEAREQFEQDIAEAEKRGAVKALREEAARGERAAAAFHDDDAERQRLGRKLLNRTAKAIAAQADRIESGEVTLP